MNRRAFLAAAGASFLRLRSRSVRVRLEAGTGVSGRQLVSFGFPLPPDFLDDPGAVRLMDDEDREVEASITPLEIWRLGGRKGNEGKLRSVLIQARVDASASLRVELGAASKRSAAPLASVAEVLADSGPPVWALLPADWLCESEVTGPQLPVSRSAACASYDSLAARSFPGSLAYIESPVFHHWLFDRTTCYHRLYARSGERRYLEAAHRAADFMRRHTEMEGADAGAFLPKGPDVKYVYPRAMHVQYLLTGDERSREAASTMAHFCFDRWEPGYRPARYKPVSPDVDPEAGREFWSPRHEAYGFLGVLHGWEVTGEERYWKKARIYADALFEHQSHPPDGRPADGSFRQNWALYDPSESLLPGATSAWMSAILLDALFCYWRLSGDDRVPAMVTRFCDFLDRRGLVPDGSRAYYVIDCLGSENAPDAPGPQEQGMERHDTELAATFAMGIFFSRDPEQRSRFRRRFERLLSEAARLDLNRPARCFNWALQSSSQMAYFLESSPVSPE